MKRIRYAFQLDGTLQSTTEFFTPQGNLCVKLNPNAQAFTIYNTSLDCIAFSGTAKVTSLKKAAKEALVSLGVTFEEETRKR